MRKREREKDNKWVLDGHGLEGDEVYEKTEGKREGSERGEDG